MTKIEPMKSFRSNGVFPAVDELMILFHPFCCKYVTLIELGY